MVHTDNEQSRRALRQVHVWVIILSTLLLVFAMSLPAIGQERGSEAHLKDQGSGNARCEPAPITMPTLPDTIPEYTALDPDTGLHVTGTYQLIDVADYKLKISGAVNKPKSLSYDDIRCLKRIESEVTLVCPGFFVDNARWAGAPLAEVIALASPEDDATHLKLVGADGYSTVISISEATADGNYLAYEWEGKPVPILHGFPVRAVFPQMEGNKWVKWLIGIEVQ